MAGDLAVSVPGHLERVIRVDVPGNHYHSIVRSIEAPVESNGIVARQLLHLVSPADHGLAVRMVEEQGGIDLLAKPSARIVLHPLIALLEYDVALRQHDLVGELQASHAISLEPHYRLEVFARHALEERGVVNRSECVLLAAESSDNLRELARGMLRGALEHQVFKQVRQSRLDGRFIGGSDFVPDHMGDHRRAMVGNDDQLQSVAQHEVGDRRAARLSRARLCLKYESKECEDSEERLVSER